MDTPEIKDLVVLAKEKDKEAFGELYDIFAARIYRFISIKVKAREHAEDILQETFLKAWRYLPRFNPDQYHFGAWLYTISRNLVNDYYRHMYRHPRTENIDDYIDLSSPPTIAETADLNLAMDKVNLVLPQLNDSYRQVLELRFIQEMSIEETAQIMGKTSLSVRVTQHRAIKKLSALLEQTASSRHEQTISN
jgi:RNA polymerase sigma-70 factor, ECF subfamily